MLMKLIKALALLILIVWGVLSLRPKVEIIYPQGEHVLRIQSMYGDASEEPTLKMMDDSKYGKNYIKHGEIDRRTFPLHSNPNDMLSIVWSVSTGQFNLDEVIENGIPLRGHLHIKRSDVDFCRLKVYIDPKGKIIKQEKYKGICIK